MAPRKPPGGSRRSPSRPASAKQSGLDLDAVVSEMTDALERRHVELLEEVLPRLPEPKNGGRRWLELGVRAITPTGVLAILVSIIGFVSTIGGDLDRNCRATESLSRGTRGLVLSDDQLNRAGNRALREQIQRAIRVPSCK